MSLLDVKISINLKNTLKQFDYKSISKFLLYSLIICLPIHSVADYRFLIRPGDIIAILLICSIFFSRNKEFENYYGIYFIFSCYLIFEFICGLLNFNLLNNTDYSAYYSTKYNYNVYAFFKLGLAILSLNILFICKHCFQIKYFLVPFLISFFMAFLFQFYYFFISIFNNSFERYFQIYRVGIFFEGNIGGMFYLLSFMIFHKLIIKNTLFNRIRYFYYIGYLISIFSIFLTQSKIAIFSLIVYLLLSIKWFNLKLFFITSIIIILSFLATEFKSKIPIYSNYYIEELESKGHGISNLSSVLVVNKNFYSLKDRLNLIDIGSRMILDNILFGSGFASYPFLIYKYKNSLDFLFTRYDFSSIQIANNFYIDIFVNGGLFGFIIYLYFFLKVFHLRNFETISTFIPILIYLNAFPTPFLPFFVFLIMYLYRLINE